MPLLVLLVILLPSLSWATIAEVGAGSQRVNSTRVTAADSTTAVMPGNVTAGNWMACAGNIGDNTGGVTSVTVTDSVSTSYTSILGAEYSGNGRSFIAYGQVPSTGANTVTVNPSGTNNFIQFGCDEFSATLPLVVDVDGASSTGSSTTPSDTITTVNSDTIIFGVAVGGTSAAITPNDGTQIAESQFAVTLYNFIFSIVSSATTYTIDWTLGISQAWTAQTYSLKEQSARRPVAPVIF